MIGAGFRRARGGGRDARARWDVTPAGGARSGRWAGLVVAASNGALIELGGEFITGGYDFTEEICARFGIEFDGMGINYPDRELVPDPGVDADALADRGRPGREGGRRPIPNARSSTCWRGQRPGRGLTAASSRSGCRARSRSPRRDRSRFALKLPGSWRPRRRGACAAATRALQKRWPPGLGDRVRLGVHVHELRVGGRRSCPHRGRGVHGLRLRGRDPGPGLFCPASSVRSAASAGVVAGSPRSAPGGPPSSRRRFTSPPHRGR